MLFNPEKIVTTTVQDNDMASIILSRSHVVVREQEAQDNYTIVLTSDPLADVTIDLICSGELEVVPPRLTFTSMDWDVPKRVEGLLSQMPKLS